MLLRLKMRSNRRREAQLARSIAAKSEEIARLEARIAEYIEMEEGVHDTPFYDVQHEGSLTDRDASDD